MWVYGWGSRLPFNACFVIGRLPLQEVGAGKFDKDGSTLDVGLEGTLIDGHLPVHSVSNIFSLIIQSPTYWFLPKNQEDRAGNTGTEPGRLYNRTQIEHIINMISDPLARFSIKERLRSTNNSPSGGRNSQPQSPQKRQILAPEHYNYFLNTIEKELKH